MPPRKACCWNYNGSTGAGEPREPEAGGVPATQLLAAKVSDPEFWGNVRKFRRHFKGLFLIGNVRVRILPGQPRSPVSVVQVDSVYERMIFP